jgi:hypothetical protein
VGAGAAGASGAAGAGATGAQAAKATVPALTPAHFNSSRRLIRRSRNAAMCVSSFLCHLLIDMRDRYRINSLISRWFLFSPPPHRYNAVFTFVENIQDAKPPLLSQHLLSSLNNGIAGDKRSRSSVETLCHGAYTGCFFVCVYFVSIVSDDRLVVKL